MRSEMNFSLMAHAHVVEAWGMSVDKALSSP